MKKIQNYINGQFLSALSKNYKNNSSPITGKIYSKFPDSDHEDIDKAVMAAKKAFPKWKSLGKKGRYNLLMSLADMLDENFDKFVEAESYDNGKPEWIARSVDIPRVSENFRFFATASLHFSSECHEMDGKAFNYTIREPIGVAGCISPWNLPIYLLTWKIAPALAAGNTVVAKPSEITPMTAYLFSKIVHKSNIPNGVINIVHGLGEKAGEALTKHPDVPVISFTGGSNTGKKININCASLFKKLSLELGGKNPSIIFNDANFNEALNISLKSAFSNQGQICLCGSRIFVQNKIYDKFKTAFVAKTKRLTVGNPKNKVDLGAIVSKAHMNKIINYIQLAQDEGGTILTGGNRIRFKGELSGGYFIEPTVIENLDYKCIVNQEEIFGPVVTIMPFENEDDVIKMANATKYGLSASIFTSNVSKAHRMSSKINSGIIWINSWMMRDLRIPFGGMKDSGIGREGGFNSLRFFTETKNICVKI